MEDYSVVIRTMGKAGEKYQKLLDSIQRLDPQPREIIVVLPEGYELPKEQIGSESFYFCPKGMVTQRLFGIEKCKTQYALITDDDISFDSDFVSKLYEPLRDGKYAISAGPLIEFFPQHGVQAIISALLGSAIPTIFHKDRYNTVLRTTGYSYNRSINVQEHQIYETQSAPWTCFFINVDEFRKIRFEDELWLDLHGYAAHDDTCMFYKAWITNHKAVVVSDASYQHLNAKTSVQGIRLKTIEAEAFNTYVFWYRFFYEQDKGVMRLLDSICLGYYQLARDIYLCLDIIRKRAPIQSLKVRNEAKKQAKQFVKSEDYIKIKRIVKE